MLDCDPARHERVIVLPKYVSREGNEAAPVIAPLPAQPQERSIVAPGLFSDERWDGVVMSGVPLGKISALFSCRNRAWGEPPICCRFRSAGLWKPMNKGL